MGWKPVFIRQRLPWLSFDRVITTVILINTALLVADFFIDGHDELFDVMDHVILTFFIAEIAIKLAALKWRVDTFLRSSYWNVFDVVVITASLLPVLGEGVTILRVARLARVMHAARHIKHLRIVELFRRRMT